MKHLYLYGGILYEIASKKDIEAHWHSVENVLVMVVVVVGAEGCW